MLEVLREKCVLIQESSPNTTYDDPLIFNTSIRLGYYLIISESQPFLGSLIGS